MNSQMNERLQMAGPKHMEMQAETTWPTASRTCGGMGQWQSPVPVVSKCL